jgi:hypothetical protein
MISSRPSVFRSYCAALIAATLVFQPMIVYAAPITTSVLAEIPLQGVNPVKPNILFTLDDSASMKWDYLPDWTAWRQVGLPTLSYCRDKRNCGGSIGDGTGANVASLPYPTRFVPYTDMDPPLRSSDFNKLYYNPAANLPAGYLTGKNSDGTNLPCEGGNTACNGPGPRST